jgi:hypothetical protein
VGRAGLWKSSYLIRAIPEKKVPVRHQSIDTATAEVI